MEGFKCDVSFWFAYHLGSEESWDLGSSTFDWHNILTYQLPNSVHFHRHCISIPWFQFINHQHIAQILQTQFLILKNGNFSWKPIEREEVSFHLHLHGLAHLLHDPHIHLHLHLHLRPHWLLPRCQTATTRSFFFAES